MEGGGAVPFEIGEGLRDERRFWVHQKWNAIPAHNPDASQPCLPIGSTEIYLRGHFPDKTQLPDPIDVEKGDDDGQWVGRLMVLESTPEDPSLPVRRHLVRITEFEQDEDPLCLDEVDCRSRLPAWRGMNPKRPRSNCCWRQPRPA